MQKKTTSIMKMTGTSLLLISLMFTCGCQSTPTSTAVVNNNDLQQKIENSSAPFAAYEAPASWQETLKIKGIDSKTEIDAAISVPDVTAFPVYKVKQIKFDETRIKTLVEYFTEGKDVFKYTEPTKAELEEELTLTKAHLAKLEADPSSDQEDIQDAEESISMLEEQIPEAPESVEPEVITDWSPDKSPLGQYTDENGIDIYISANSDRFDYDKGYAITESRRLLNDLPAVGDIAISKEDAARAAQGLLHNLGIDYMTDVSLEKAERFSTGEDAFTSDKEPLSKGYLIKFARNINGILGITNVAVMYGMKEDFDYKAPLYPEEIQIYVDETGQPQSFSWLYPLEIQEKISENVSLLPYEDIQQRIRNMLTFMNSFDNYPTTIPKIEMNMAIVNVKDHPDEAMYIPAWFIYYSQTFTNSEDGNKEHTQVFRLGLNAIDGGRILERPVTGPDTQ